MTPYKQTDYSDKLGTCDVTIATDGCFCTSLAMMVDKTPPEVNNLLKDNLGYVDGCLVSSPNAAIILNLDYFGTGYTSPDFPCIAETNDYKSKGYPQHFFVWLGNGMIIDPLIGYETVNNYNIKSYRLFKTKGEPMPEQCFADRNMVVSILKDFLTRWYDDYLGYPLDDVRLKIIEDQANQIADNNINLAQFMKEFKPEFSKVWMKKTECILPEIPPCDCSKEIADATKDLQDEQIKIMQEQQVTLDMLNKKMLDLQAKADSGVAAYDGGQLIALGIKKWLGLL